MKMRYCIHVDSLFLVQMDEDKDAPSKEASEDNTFEALEKEFQEVCICIKPVITDMHYSLI